MKIRNVACAAVLAVLVIAGGSTAFGATMGPWRLLLPGNAVSAAVTPSPEPGAPSILLAGTLGGGVSLPGVARSTDGGASWANVLSYPAFSLCVDPNNPSVVYAATSAGLHKSVDYGVTWAMLHPGIRTSIAVSPANSAVLYGDHLMSPNGGLNWTAMAGLPPFQFSPSGFTELPHIRIAPSNPNVLYAVVAEGGYVSVNGGITWSPWQEADTVEIDPTDFRIVYQGRCGGAERWIPSPSGNVYGVGMSIGGHTHAFAIDPTSPNQVFAVSNGSGIARSGDYGATWRAYGPPRYQEVPAGRMVFDPSDGKLYLPTIQGYNSLLLNGLWAASTWSCTDMDGDGFAIEGETCGIVDCNDDNPTAFPGAREIKHDGVDQDCNGYDLTIDVLLAEYDAKKLSLKVIATSRREASASLILGDDKGPMTWVPNRGWWEITTGPIKGDPEFVTVTGFEGSETAPTTRK